MANVRTIETNGIALEVTFDGPEDGRPVLLLHGFPECAHTWRKQIPVLAAAGYRVIAPDQRGYGRSSRPREIAAYRRSELVKDLVGLLDALNVTKADIVSHDWGGAIGWYLAESRPDRVNRLAVLNCPHPSVFAKALRNSRQQKRKSSYMVFFQIPKIPEWWLSRSDFSGLVARLRGMAHAHAFSEADFEIYKERWRQPDAMRGMLNWYRAAARFPEKGKSASIEVPTLLLWGVNDAVLGEELAEASIARCTHGRLHRVQNAGHFVQVDAPEEVNQQLLAFLSAPAN